ncbi:unnamed protein product [Didymodactylos carnosus]|uniref:SGNH hydrolase-type esterase domain-containing protein n=1 Tax=Didymodactylos carnosus TaxID=1234261 RepID=A0A814G2N3_9BILA|nr:unnamed protein product [Didymodactylos carnosus]CAF1348405.1 unnamed protein product [Didymodactylos carnosus]CAF3765086.1 unnamed protein product [Didymodactylos carnosus]CAF4159154.1 unnamed protein product [Didymodactylos carnosus]
MFRFVLFYSIALATLTFAAKPWAEETREQWWLDHHNTFLQQTQSNPNGIRVVFLGDSITKRWLDGARNIWNMHYASRGAVNYGIDGDRTQHILWRIHNGELTGLSPKLVVLKIGTNNISSATADDISKGVQTIVQDIRQMLPNTRMLLLGVLSRNNVQWISDDVARINAIISIFDDSYWIGFLDMTSSFQNSHLQVKPELYTADLLHLSVPGYQQWYNRMEFLFYGMLNY